MLTHTIAVVVGIFVGWNIPQPEFAKPYSDKVINWLKEHVAFFR